MKRRELCVSSGTVISRAIQRTARCERADRDRNRLIRAFLGRISVRERAGSKGAPAKRHFDREPRRSARCLILRR